MAMNTTYSDRLLAFYISGLIWTTAVVAFRPTSSSWFVSCTRRCTYLVARGAGNASQRRIIAATEASRTKTQGSIQRTMTASGTDGGDRRTLRVLALHGSGGTASDFPSRFDVLSRQLTEKYHTDLAVTVVQGPFDKDQGYSWWTMPPGVRSFTADIYTGFEESATRVLDVWEKEHDGFDLVIGHSQGAILIASLLALQRVPYHPRLGYIMNGVSFPNPYRSQIDDLTVIPRKEDEDSTDIHGVTPRMLFVMGTNDKITPNETGEELRDGMKKTGMHVSTIYHTGGHAIPSDEDTVEKICHWMTKRFRPSDTQD